MWLYRIIPASWAVCAWWQIPLWALFGNDEDGIFGEHSGVLGYQGGPMTFWQFVRWWTRNPMKNLWWHVLSFPLWWSFVLIGTPEATPPFFPKGDGILLSVNVLPLFAFHWHGWEGYAGYHPWQYPDGRWIAAFGLALRRNESL